MPYIMFLALLASCAREEQLPPIPRPVALTMSVEGDDLVMGDTLFLTFEVTEDSITANEDFALRLSVSEDGSDASAYFEDFPHEIPFAKGDTLASAAVPVAVSGISGAHTLTVDAFSRGYRISGTPKDIRLSDYHRVSVGVKNSADGKVTEGETFVIEATLGVTAQEDIVIGLSMTENAESLSGLPESLVIREGSSRGETSPVRMLSDGGRYMPETLTISLTSSSSEHPLWSETLAVVKVDADRPLGALVADERHLYPHPDVAYASTGRLEAVRNWGGQTAVEAVAGQTLHPTLPGWIFRNAVEFHYIQDMLYNNNVLGQPNAAGGQDRPHSFWDQNTPKVEKYMKVNNDRYAAITSGGYMRMWAAKDPSVAKGYGTGALYSNKFKNPAGANSNTAKPMYCHILPGMRVEFRMRVAGELNGFNPAVWLMGNSNIQPSGPVAWPTCGEIDVVEIPVGDATGKSPWQSFHFGNEAKDGTDAYKPSTNALQGVDPLVWNIYWVEWTDDSSVSLGINGQTNLTVTRKEVEAAGAVWPFDMIQNPYGLHLVLTMGCPAPNPWALGFSGTPPEGWDSGFASLTYAESRTSPLAPRMEVDWIRYYISDIYPSELPTAYNTFKFY